MIITRRLGLQWIAAAAALPALATPARAETAGDVIRLGAVQAWPVQPIAPLSGPGYGTDPDLMEPHAPWPLTLGEAQKRLLTRLGDLILPRDDTSPGAGEAGVVAFFDEWLSAPYETQQNDRDQILRGLMWLDAQSGGSFADAAAADQTRILDAIALPHGDGAMASACAFFQRLRCLFVIGFFTMPEGLAALDYQGNTPTRGPYPGPSEDAMAHFHALLTTLNLKDPGKPWETA